MEKFLTAFVGIVLLMGAFTEPPPEYSAWSAWMRAVLAYSAIVLIASTVADSRVRRG